MRSTIFGLVLIIAGQLMAATPEQSHLQIIPAVASTQGVGGSIWRTDIIVHNPSDRAVMLNLDFLPSGIEGVGSDPEVIELGTPLGPSQTTVVADVVGSHFPNFKTGALVVWALDIYGEPIPIAASSRTWTPSVVEVRTGRESRRCLEAQRFPQHRGEKNPRSRVFGWVQNQSRNRQSHRHDRRELRGRDPRRLGRINGNALLPAGSRCPHPAQRHSGRIRSRGRRLHRRRQADAVGGSGGEDLIANRAPNHPTSWSTARRSISSPTTPPISRRRPRPPSPDFPRHRVIPAAAKTEGADGSVWQTDVTIHSAGDGGCDGAGGRARSHRRSGDRNRQPRTNGDHHPGR